MSKKHVEPAFPTQSEMLGHNAGMSLRDYFAAKAMPMINQSLCWEDIARFAYQMADAMLAERAK